MRTKRILKCRRRNYCEFNFFVQLQKENYSLLGHSETHANLLWSCSKPPAGFAERDKKLYWRLDCRSEWLHTLYLYLDACDLYSLCRKNRLQLSIGEWLRDHKETITAACSSDIKMNTCLGRGIHVFLGRGIHGLVEFHVFSCVFR